MLKSLSGKWWAYTDPDILLSSLPSVYEMAPRGARGVWETKSPACQVKPITILYSELARQHEGFRNRLNYLLRPYYRIEQCFLTFPTLWHMQTIIQYKNTIIIILNKQMRLLAGGSRLCLDAQWLKSQYFVSPIGKFPEWSKMVRAEWHQVGEGSS